MTLGQGHDTLLSHKQCLFEVRTSSVTALLQDMDWTQISIGFSSHARTLGQDDDTPSGHKQCLFEVRISNVSHRKRYGPETNL